jgi:type III pantothenate kinase
VGADRIVNAVGAFGRWPGGLIVVDLGTALTFDVVSPRGEYLGGSIAPGLRIAVDALFQRTSKLPRIDLVPPDHALGTTTVESIRSGIFYGFAGLIDGNVNALRRELDFPAKVVGTGGHIFLMRGLSATLEDCDEFLTLNGLRVIATRIQGA